MKGFTFISFILFFYFPLSFAQNPPQTAIASSHPLATQAGMQILKQGGNAFDAAIAVAAVLTVAQPNKCSLGGSATWLLHVGKNGQNIVIDASENPMAASLGYLASHYGNLPLQKSLAPAIQSGFDAAKVVNTLVTVREPLIGHYHHMRLVSTPLPSTGAITLFTLLNILSEFELSDLSDADHKHLIIESLRQVDCDKAKYLEKYDVEKVDVYKLLSEEHAENLRKNITLNKATPSKALGCGAMPKENEESTHFVILDQQGNSVSATLSTNQKTANRSATPSFFETSQGMGIIGTSGGSRTPSIMLLALLSAQRDYLPHTWMLAGRFYQENSSDIVEFEPRAFTTQLQHALQLRGHHLQQTDEPYGDMQAIFWNKKENKVYAASDPRGHGLAIVESLGDK